MYNWYVIADGLVSMGGHLFTLFVNSYFYYVVQDKSDIHSKNHLPTQLHSLELSEIHLVMTIIALLLYGEHTLPSNGR